MFWPKYFDKILKAQAAQGPVSDMPPFDATRMRGRGGIFSRIVGALLEDPRWALAFLRRWRPVFRIGSFVLVTRDEDVREILERESEFISPYAPEMTEMGGANFILGMQDGEVYRKLKSSILTAFPPREVEQRVRPIAARHARDILDKASPGFDAIGQLMKRVPVRICREYFGMIIDDEDEFADWSIALSALFFADPNADKATRELAVVASDRMRKAVDRSIAAVASGHGLPDTPLARLVNLMGQGRITLPEIHGVMLGMISGFAPTNLLGGGNCLDVILSRDEALQAVKTAVGANDNAALDAAVLEAMRFKPIFVGPWRYASADLKIAVGTSRETTIASGSTVMPATMSAMFDPAAVERPDEFMPGRPKKIYLVYGHGIHVCIGAEVARVQIGECLRAIFAKKNVRRMAGREGRMTRRGAFPDRLRIDFDRGPLDGLVDQTLLTVILPVARGKALSDVRADVARLGNPAGAEMREALDQSGVIHFTSIAVVETGKTDQATGQGEGVVILEISGDGDRRGVLAAYANHAGVIVRSILDDACGLPAREELVDLLDRAVVEIGPGFGKTAGLGFCGTPGHSVARIKAEARLADLVEEVVERPRPGNPAGAAAALSDARKALVAAGRFDWAFRATDSSLERREGSFGAALSSVLSQGLVVIPLFALLAAGALVTMFYVFSPVEGVSRSMAIGIAAMLIVAVGLALGAARMALGMRYWLSGVLALLSAGTIYAMFRLGAPPDSVLRTGAVSIASLLISIVGLVVFLSALLAGVVALLQRSERREGAGAHSISLARLADIQSREDREPAQNNLTAVSVMKPGLLRRLTLRLAFFVILTAAVRVFRPGLLGSIGSIHFARWVLVPGTDRLVFFSNYGGSWESYLEDFVAKASKGLTGVWSNTIGYPRTNFLFFDGAQDGDRFKRWARRQQVPTLFWYSAYPELNTRRIRTNSLIRRGICRASDSQARDWVSLFGSRPRPRVSQKRFELTLPQLPPPPETLETGEIQSIFFNAFGKLEEGHMLVFAVPDGLPRTAGRGWLEFLATRISFGDVTPLVNAMTVGVGPRALLRLGLEAGPDEDVMARFPNAYLQGMSHPQRSRILDDTGDSRPANWRWGVENSASDLAGDDRAAGMAPGDRPGDMVVLCYARSDTLLASDVAEVKARAAAAGLGLTAEIPLTVKRREPKECETATTGRQPAIEQFGFADGISQPAVRGTSRAIARPKPDNTIAAGEILFGYRDEHGFYPVSPAVKAASDPDGILPWLRYRRGDDGVSERLRDFGRNGSFMVIRQFEQHVDVFDTYCSHAATQLQAAHGDPTITGEWVAAKVMGRWRDGSSLVRNPEGRPERFPDNDFSYGAEDPQGLRCPFGSHIRRSNPRDSLGDDHATQIRIGKRHRILRVGRTYETIGGSGETEKGLMFICLNADIERQYEFMQQTWVASASFHGLKGEKDPAIGSSDGTGRYTIPRWDGNVVLRGLPNFVTTRGGGYFFMPSRAAVRYLISRL